MSGASLTAARDALAAVFTTDVSIGTPVAALSANVTRVYDHEPKPGVQIKGCVVTVSSAGMTPDFFLVAVRIYQQFAVNPRNDSHNLDAAVQAVDDLVPSDYGPSNWTIEVREDIDALVAEAVFERGREDYY